MASRPLLANRADADRFVETDAASTLGKLARRGRNVVVIGARGVGKTSLLHVLEYRLRRERVPVVFASLSAIDGVGAATVTILEAASRAGALETLPADVVSTAMSPEHPFGPNAAIQALSETDPDTVFLVDDPSARVGHALFGRLRDAVWGIDRAWVVAVGADQASGLLEPPADAFFDQQLHLPDLTAAEQREVAERHFGDEVSPDLVEMAVANPFLETATPRDLIHLVQLMLDADYTDPSRLGQGAQLRSAAAVEAIGDVAGPLLRELDARGAVSAGDAGLLSAMGWSRPRAVSVLNQLASSGVVRAFEAAPSGPGRPRKVYELRPMTDFVPEP